MGKQTAQGTRFESYLRESAKRVGRENTERLAKTAIAHEPDVFIPGANRRAAVAWEHWQTGGGRRKARRMVTITFEHFLELLASDEDFKWGYYVQCKSTQRMNMRTIMDGLLGWFRLKGMEDR